MTIWKRLDSQTTGVAIYNFKEEGPFRLPLDLGEKVQILEENSGWYRGFSLRNKNVQGIFPASYIHINGHLESTQDSSFKEDSVLEELTSVLREWGAMWKKLYLRKQEEQFKLVQKLMLELMDWRRQILSGKLPIDQLKQLKSRITASIDYGNRILGLDLVVRDDFGNIINPDATGVIELYRRHLSTSNKAESSLEEDTQGTRLGYTIHCMYVNLKNVVCKINDDAQVFLALYDAKEQQFISEQYMVSWDKAGMPKQIDKLGNLSIVFSDLGSKDLIRERMYIVCQIIRVGRMDQKESDNKKFTHNLRRAFGVCVLFIGNYITGKDQVDEDKEHFLQLYPVTAENKSIEASIKECISRSHETGKGTDEGVFVSIKLLHGDIEQVRADYPLLVNKHTTIARKQGFPEVIMPGDVRNDMYVTILQGEFERGRKTTSKNIEVTMQVCMPNGELIKGVICLGAGDEMVDEYHSVIYYHVGSPKWSETVKLQIPLDQFKNAHLKFTFRHRPRHEERDRTQKVFAFSYTRLMHNDGTTLLDGGHDLLVYECEGKKLEPKVYLQLPSARGEIGLSPARAGVGAHGMHVSIRESFQITTLLCSTKLTQNVDLLGLLKWRSMQGKLKDILVTVMKVSGEEIVKFLTDTFDALFAILMDNAQRYDKLVFDALVFTINMLADKKYHHFRPVLDAYIETRYNATKAYATLMQVLRQYVDTARGKADKQRLDLLLKAMKAIEYIFKFIVQSRVLYERAIGDKGRSEFEEELRQLFTSLIHFMEDKKHETVLTQGACLKYFPSTFGDLLKVFDAKELGYYARDLIQNIPKGRLVSQRMACVHHMVKSKLFSNPDSRSVLLPMIVKQLGEDMEKGEDMKMCMDILNEMLISLTRDNVGDTHDDVLKVVTSLLRVVVKVVISMDRSQSVAGNCVACLTAMLHLMDEEHYRLYIDHFPDRSELLHFLMELFLLFREFVSNNMYPKDWMVMTMLQNSVILNAMQYFSEALLEMFLVGDNFQIQVWNNFFHLAVAFITQESLQLENFSSAKQNKILEKYSDMRMIIGLKILDMWRCLGSNKGKFIPGLVGPFLEMTLIPQEELRRATIPIFYDMMDCEFRSQGNLLSVEAEIISKLDVLVEGGKGDEKYKELFYKILSDLFLKNPSLYEIGTNFVALVTKLMERLLDYRTVIQGDDSIDNRMSCTVNVLDFYKEIRREEMYIRYVYKLCDLHLSVENYTEAAFTLRLHADLLNWSDELVHARHTGKYPASTQRQLKEILYKEIIEYFEKGKTWEYAIHFCKKLAEQYEEHTFDFIELSQVLLKQAKFYDNIITVVRGDPEYFRVGFYGKAFPTFLRNRVFVYRGKEFEKLGEFTVRIKSQYPNAKLLNYTTPPDDDVKNSPNQFLQINKVDPVPVEWRKFQGKNVMEQITKFYEVNHVNKFQFSRPFHKSKVDKEKEFASLWLERTILYTKDKFPGNLCWFEVTSSFVEEISPIAYAIETMELTTKQLRSLIGRHKTDVKLNINNLSMKLNGIIDAAVNGGISNYEKAFLIPEFQQQNPDAADHVNKLKELIVVQVQVLEEGVALHAARVPESLKPFHEQIEKCYKEMKTKVAPLRKQSRMSTTSMSRSRTQEPRPRPSLIYRESMDLPSASIKFDDLGSPPPVLPEKEKRKQTLTLSPGDFPNYYFKTNPSPLTPTREEDPPPPPKPVRKLAQNGVPPRLPDKMHTKVTADQRGSTGSSSSGDNEYVADPTEQAPKLPPRRPTILEKDTQESPPVPPKKP